LSHKFGGELAEDVQESQVEGRATFALRTGVLKSKLDTISEERRRNKQNIVSRY